MKILTAILIILISGITFAQQQIVLNKTTNIQTLEYTEQYYFKIQGKIFLPGDTIRFYDEMGTPLMIRYSVTGAEMFYFVLSWSDPTAYVLSTSLKKIKIRLFTNSFKNTLLELYTYRIADWNTQRSIIDTVFVKNQAEINLNVDSIITKDTVTVRKLIDNNVTVSNAISVSSMPNVNVVGIDSVFVVNQSSSQGKDTVTVRKLVDNNVTVSNAISISSMPNVNVVGTFWQATQPVSISNLHVVGDTMRLDPAFSNPVSLGTSIGKTVVMKTGTLVTTATTADQVVLTYTVTAGKIYYISYVSFMSRLTTLSATASILGTMSLESPGATKLITITRTNPTISYIEPYTFVFAEPVFIGPGVVVRVVCTPAATTSMTWIANFGGFEK